MAVNTSRAWTGSTIAPQVTPASSPAIGSSNIPAAVTGNQLPQGQFYNSLLSSLFGMGGNQNQAPAGPQMSPQQGNAINWMIQQIGAENWNRQRDQELLRAWSPAPLGVPLSTLSSFGSGVTRGFEPIGANYNPVMETALSNARLFPSIQLGTAAAGFGSGGGAAPARTSSGWVASPWGF